jgi:hypothetical protein
MEVLGVGGSGTDVMEEINITITIYKKKESHHE